MFLARYCKLQKLGVFIMSLEAWKAKYLSVTVQDCSAEDALEHSRLKWEGLQVENLEEFGCHLEGAYLIDYDDSSILPIDSSNCALCAHYLLTSNDFKDTCAKCPIDSCGAEWLDFLSGDPLPMYNKIKAVIEK